MKQNKIINNKNLTILMVAYVVAMILTFATSDTVVHAEQLEVAKVEEPAEQTLDEVIKYKGFNIQRDQLQKVVEVFGKDPKIIAIIIAESGFDGSLIGYNCYYATGKGDYNKHLKMKVDYTDVSKTRRAGDVGWACKKEHRQYAFSKDIGLLMINTSNGAKIGDLDHNLAVAKKLLDTNGYNAWSAYSLGMTDQYMDEAKEILTYIK